MPFIDLFSPLCYNIQKINYYIFRTYDKTLNYEEVKNAYYNWIDSIMDGKSFLTKQVVEIFESTVQAFSTSKVVRLKLIEIATVHNYRDANWAINIYNKDCKKPGAFIGVEQKQNVGIDPNSVF